MKIQDFSGGLAKRTDPQFLALNQGYAFTNIAIASKVLRSINGPSLTTETLDQFTFWYTKGQRWLSFPNPTSCVEVQGRVYTANGANTSVVIDNDTKPLGLENPTTAVGASVSTGGSVDIGTLQYTYTIYDPSTGFESGPAPVSADIVTVSGDQTVDLSALPALPAPLVKRIYRIGGPNTVFTLVDTVASAATTYTDTAAAIALTGQLLTTQGYQPAPAVTHLAEYNGMLFGAFGYTVRFTPVGVYNAWPEALSISYTTEVIGVVPTGNGLLVLTRAETYVIIGTGAVDIVSRLLDSKVGCKSWYSIQRVSGFGVWVSDNGICISNGGSVDIPSLDILGELNINAISSAATIKRYFVVDASGSTFVLDLRYGVNFYEEAHPYSAISSRADELFGWYAGKFYNLYRNPTVKLPFKYLSPLFVEGSSTELKSYKKIYIFSKGVIIIRIRVEDKWVLTSALKEGKNEIQIPEADQRGHYLQIELTGEGEVLEYEYVKGSN